MRSRVLPLALAVLFMSGLVPGAAGAAKRTGGAGPARGALPDTGLFAPVARQNRAALDRLALTARQPITPERVLLLLATGQLDEAARAANALPAGDPANDVARGRVALARFDFAPLAALVPASPATGESDALRSLRYAWLAARDDAAAIDSFARAHLAREGDAQSAPELLALGRVALDQLDYARAESSYTRALAVLAAAPAPPAWGDAAAARRAAARIGLATVHQKRREWDASLVTLRSALADHAGADALMALTETLIRLGRTDEAISAAEWAVRLSPDHESAHYLLGNGYARRNYTQLVAAYPAAFADAAGRRALAAADALLGAGRRDEARVAYARVIAAHPGWADARVRLASLDFEDARYDAAREQCDAALRACPEYGRAHAVLAKALESQRFAVDVHRAGYEDRFAAEPMPVVPGIERFVTNWHALSPRHQKRVALSVAPWLAFVPVLVQGGATYYIKPLWMLLSECPDLETLRDQRIDYDSRLWDDVRGCGGYHTVTGIEDVERTIFDRYNTVLHELSHQVHAVLPVDDSRTIQEHYRLAKERDDQTREGFLSRYAGGSVYEYFAEGANALESPKRDAYDPREVVRERLEKLDPALRDLIRGLFSRTDVEGSFPVAYAAGGDDRVGRGRVDDAIPFYQKALAREAGNETALLSYSRALLLAGRGAAAESAAAQACALQPASGAPRVQLAQAAWHAGRALDRVRAPLAIARDSVRAEDRYQVDIALAELAWTAGDAAAALAAADSVLAYQSDSPSGQQLRAAALALTERWDEAFAQYESAVRMRTGIVDLRNAYARDLLRAGRTADARAQLDAAKLLDEENATAEALRAWAALSDGRIDAARAHAKQAILWGPRCDLAQIVAGAIEQRTGRTAAARAAWAGVDARLAAARPPEWIFRPKLSTWEQVGALPAVERRLLEEWRK